MGFLPDIAQQLVGRERALAGGVDPDSEGIYGRTVVLLIVAAEKDADVRDSDETGERIYQIGVVVLESYIDFGGCLQTA